MVIARESAIQHSAASMFGRAASGILGRPVKPGDDRCGGYV